MKAKEKMKKLSIAIIGGGIGGMATALSLFQAGFDVHVYEKARELGEVGAGIQVSPNATRILHGFGLAEKLATMGVRPLAWQQRRWDNGKILLQTPLGDAVEEAFGYPYYQMHRSDLLSALIGILPVERVHPGHRCINVIDQENNVEINFENGSKTQADIVIGADGIHSVVRSTLFGTESPHFTGCVAYRGLVPKERLSHLNLDVTSQVWMGPEKHFVHYFVRNKELINFVAIVEQDTWTRESWTDRCELSQVLAAFEGWHPQVRSILEAVDDTFIWGLFDRAPLPKWSVGRISLLGDACHPMLPFMAQGASQAIEDGAALAAILSDKPERDIAESLKIYEQIRLPRASKVQGMSAQNKKRFHLPDGAEQQKRDAEMASGATDWALNAIAWIYGHDARKLT